ncbi:hypothetical protein PF003_g23831 [Phytophthora fragariae]|nr:hypothetical protein PF003_g23831 [Phytophthora fragariae]
MSEVALLNKLLKKCKSPASMSRQCQQPRGRVPVPDQQPSRRPAVRRDGAPSRRGQLRRYEGPAAAEVDDRGRVCRLVGLDHATRG